MKCFDKSFKKTWVTEFGISSLFNSGFTICQISKKFLNIAGFTSALLFSSDKIQTFSARSCKKANRKTGTRDPSGTLQKPENRNTSGTLQKPENRDPSGTLRKPGII